MIGNCRGCEYEVSEAYWQQKNYGLHVATVKNDKTTYPNNKGHYFCILVNDEGKIVIG